MMGVAILAIPYPPSLPLLELLSPVSEGSTEAGLFTFKPTLRTCKRANRHIGHSRHRWRASKLPARPPRQISILATMERRVVDVASVPPVRIGSGQTRLLAATRSAASCGIFPFEFSSFSALRSIHSLEVNLCGTLVHLIRNTSRQPAQSHCFTPVSFSEALCPIQNNLPSGGPIHIAEGPRF
jgi:hypothetical protein